MKRTLSSISFLLVLFCRTSAQNFPSYGKVSKGELELKECSFDKEAAAVVLLDEANSYYNGAKNLITNRHIRIKILKEKGLRYGDVSIRYIRKDNFEHIGNIKAITINTDDHGVLSRREIEKNLIFNKNISASQGEVSFAFPGVAVGSIVEYTYESKMQHYGGLRDWYFQYEIPVASSKYHLFIVPGYEFTYRIHKSPVLDMKVEPDSSNGSIRFEMKNIPGLESESYMDARKDYVQRVEFQLSEYGSNWERKKFMTSWDEVAREWMSRSDFGSQLNKGIPRTGDFIHGIRSNSSALEKVNVVLKYVRDNIRWDGEYSLVSTRGIKEAWNRKAGNSAEINLILINLLKDAGLEAYPMLVSERSHGKVYTQYPFIDQFNSVYTVVLIDGRKYYLNAADPITPPQLTPHTISNTTAYIFKKDGGELSSIHDESGEYRDNLTLLASVTPEGNIRGEGFMTSTGYARVSRLYQYKRNKEEYITSCFKKSAQGIDSFKIINEYIDTLPLQQKFVFEKALGETGEYIFVPTNLFTGFEVNPFISDKRFSDINFGFKQVVITNAYLNIPPAYTVDGTPKSITLTNVDKTIDFVRQIIVDQSGEKLLVRMRIDFKKSFYPVEEYMEIREFYRKMFELLNENIVLRKKPK